MTFEEEAKSEFGKGLTYCLGLFLAHAERYRFDKQIYAKAGRAYIDDHVALSWFNGASDHLYELDTSRVRDAALKARLEALKDKALEFGHGFPKVNATEKDVEWAIAEAKACLLEIDRQLGVPAVKGSYE
jgi:hypothetical protein